MFLIYSTVSQTAIKTAIAYCNFCSNDALDADWLSRRRCQVTPIVAKDATTVDDALVNLVQQKRVPMSNSILPYISSIIIIMSRAGR